MSASQRRKGRGGEREAWAFIREHGLECDQVRLNQTRDGGPDLDAEFGPVEVKRRARLPAYVAPAPDVRAVFLRADRGGWLCVLRAEDALRLLLREREQVGYQQAKTVSGSSQVPLEKGLSA